MANDIKSEFAKFIEKNADKPVRYALFGVLVDKWKEMNAKNIERNARLDALEKRLADLEAQPLLKDGGTWRHGSTYRRGDVTQFKGARWVCIKAHTANGVPDHECWQLWEKTIVRDRGAR